MNRTLGAAIAVVVSLLGPQPSAAQERGAVALAELVSGLGVSARVLVIGAHPDDEDTRLIAWLTRGRHVETAYLSLTRGDGGQNLIGNELGEALGVIRTEELLAARRVDGGHQYFTRAYDFGFSKSADETYRHWPKAELLNDVVTVVRSFRPHIIVSVFSGTPADGHGHHQVAGMIAREAYDIAGDTVRIPRRLTHGAGGWTPSKFYRSTNFRPAGTSFRYNAGEYSPLLGRSYAEIAAESRSQHRSQAFGVLQRRGPVTGALRRDATRVNESQRAEDEQSLFDGIDTSWTRFKNGESKLPAAFVDSLLREIRNAQRVFSLRSPEAVVEPLVRIIAMAERASSCSVTRPSSCAGLTPSARDDQVLSFAILQRRAEEAAALAVGVAVEATAPRELWASSDTLRTVLRVYNRSSSPMRIGARDITPAGIAAVNVEASIARDSVFQSDAFPRTEGLTQPWWLERPRTGDMFSVPIDTFAEGARTSAAASEVTVGVGGRRIPVHTPVVYRFADPIRGDMSRPIAIVPMLSVTLDGDVDYAQANADLDRSVRVTVRSSATSAQDVRISLRVPQGLAIDSARMISIPAGGVRAVSFRVRGRLGVGRHIIRAVAETGGQTFASGYTLVDYEHIRPQRVYRNAQLAIEAIDVVLPARLNVAYVRGVGDNIPPILRQLGVPLTLLGPAEIATSDLSAYSAVLVGPRAYESDPELIAVNNRLLDYVKSGGTMVVQYGQMEMQQPGIMPYPITLNRPPDRVTEEGVPVRILDPASRLLTTPNRVTADDFNAWVQDRAQYMPRTFDPKYTPLVGMSDPGEPENLGALLVTKYGSGTYVYTTLAFFRQLPAGVPGAARLFVNLMAAGDTRAAGGPPRRENKPVP